MLNLHTLGHPFPLAGQICDFIKRKTHDTFKNSNVIFGLSDYEVDDNLQFKVLHLKK